MTDMKLDSEGDLLIENGRFILFETVEEWIRQKVLITLSTISGTWFADINFGINSNLVFQKGTQTELDQNIKKLISEIDGVVSLVSFSSTVGYDRVYRCSFEYSITTGEITSIANLPTAGGGAGLVTEGIFIDGVWDFTGTWDNKETWGE